MYRYYCMILYGIEDKIVATRYKRDSTLEEH